MRVVYSSQTGFVKGLVERGGGGGEDVLLYAADSTEARHVFRRHLLHSYDGHGTLLWAGDEHFHRWDFLAD